MIAQIQGRFIEKTPTYVIISCNGLGYHVNISLQTFETLPKEENALLFTHFVVREDNQLLYGFATKEERQIFRHLISVSGVGPNTALVMLSSLSTGEIVNAIQKDQVTVLKGVKGIGAKTAQRIIIDLRDKIAKLEDFSDISLSSHNTIKEEALSALSMLGFAKAPAEKVVSKLLQAEPDVKVEKLIKLALNGL